MFNKRNRRHISKLNNSGSTMLVVVVAISLIAILATVLMSMSYLNYSMKVTELNSKKNFYTAESVLDQINVGLQSEISESVEDAYVRAMQRYSSEADTLRNTNFANYYISELTGKLRTASDANKYEIAVDADGDGVYDAGLVQYLDDSLQQAYTSGDLEITSIDQKMESVAVAVTDETGATTYQSRGLILYNLRIAYTDAQEYMSVIETDIRIQTPSLTLVTKTALPDVFEYSIVADAGIIGGTATVATIKGNVYAGGHSTTDAGGISVTQGHTWNFEEDGRVISGGPVRVATTGALTTSEDTENWFQSIELPKYTNLTSGTLNLAGHTYVADDLTVEGSGAEVTLSGSYYGFGNDATGATGNSAIILNGKNATVDMSGLESLKLGGNAYIQTSGITYTADPSHNTDVLMGNSLAVKSDQIVYLVPAECIGVLDGDTKIGRNPMSSKQYEQWVTQANNNSNFELVSLTKEMNVVGKSISEYSYNGIGYKTVFRHVNGDTLCYVYLDLTTDGASQYYQDYYNAATDKMKHYIQTYNNRIIVNPDLAELETKGTLLSYSLGDNGIISITDNTIDSSRTQEELDALNEEQVTNQERFARLNAKLTMEANSVTGPEMNNTVYHNLINDTAMQSLTAAPQRYNGPNGLYAYVVNNRGGATFEYDSNKYNACVIIATGDVAIKRNFSGIIICDGKIIISGGGSITVSANKADVIKMLRCKAAEDPDAKTLIETYFVDGEKYSLDSSLTSHVNNNMQGQQIGELIIYENWTKQ